MVDNMRKGYEKRFNKNDIVYFLKPRQRYERIQYGIVDEQFSDAVCIDLLSWRECKTINGIRWDEWEPDYRPKKLLKGWTYNTRLWSFGHTEDVLEITDAFKRFNIADKELIHKHIFETGFIVKRTMEHYAIPNTVIEKGTWYLKKSFPMYDPCPTSISLPPCEAYNEYEEAQKALDEYDKERERIANLSDKDWSIEQIKKTIETWSGMYRVEPDDILKATNFLLSLKNIEDVEVRIFSGLQWKYWKNKKWNSVDI
jgi:hypothetical protein